jgi:D-beta-D-heptose 7-phosphate kinase/D-beta-D-heptose 1-phosphate adenosyltransferase
MKDKIKTIEEMEKIAADLRKQGKTIVMTSGMFDILHSAHINFFRKAKELGDVFIVFLNNDVSTKKNKGETRPIVPEKERANILSAIEYIDYIVLFGEEKPLECYRRVKGQICVKGGSYDAERLKEQQKLLDGWGGIHKIFELEKGISTTNIIEKVLKTYK